MADAKVGTGKFLSLVLRHQPEQIGITLDPARWASVDELLRACRPHGREITLDESREVVSTSDKRRFAFSEDGEMIRGKALML